MVFDMIVHAVENMMMKVKIPQKTNWPRNVAETKKVELVVFTSFKAIKCM
jgi:hypothetical protein